MSTTEEQSTQKFLQKIFKGNLEHIEEFAEELEKHKDGQDPITTTITCCDSRVMERDMIGNKELGDDFTHEVIGNHVLMYNQKGEPVVSGSIDYIPAHTDTHTIIAVIGHTGCGAVTAAYNTLKELEKEKTLEELDLKNTPLEDYNGETEGINSEIRLILETGLIADYQELEETAKMEQKIDKLVERNVDNQVNMLLQNTNYTNTTIIGLVYDMKGSYNGDTGQIYLTNINGETNKEKLTQKLESNKEIVIDRISKS